MMNNNKILTVSYGTFSCTLEGFDDSFGTMKAIAEYFRDLASDDRYFGAEPPQPDAEMLARIAQKEVSRRVEAHERDGKIVLSAVDDANALAAGAAVTLDAASDKKSEASAAAPAEHASVEVVEETPETELDAQAGQASEADEQVDEDQFEEDILDDDLVEDTLSAEDLVEEETTAEDADVEFVEDENDIVPGKRDADVEAFFDGTDEIDAVEETPVQEPARDTPPSESIAAKLQRIRAVVAQQDDEDEDDDFSEDEHANAAATAAEPARDVVEDARRDIEDALQADESADLEAAEQADDGVSDEEVDDIADILRRLESTDDAPKAEARHAKSSEAAAKALHLDAEEQLEDDGIALDNVFEDDTVAAQDPVDVMDTPAPVANVVASKGLRIETTPAEASPKTPNAPRARVIKVKRADLEAAIENGDLEEYEDEDDATPMSLDDMAPSRNGDTSLSAEDEDELARELAALEADMGQDDDAEEAEIVVEADTVEDERGTSDDTIAAALAELEKTPEPEGEPEAPAAKTPRPRARLPEIDADQNADVSRLLAEADSQMGEPESATRRDAFAHLRAAVAAKKADQAMGTKDDEKGDDAYRSDLADVVRPRRPASGETRTKRPGDGRPAPLKLVAEQRIDVSETAASKGPVSPRRVAKTAEVVETGEGSFVDFANEMGATKLPELLEAAAAYMSFVEGRENFSRPQLMSKVRQAGPDGFNREDTLRSFGKLLREGKIEKIKAGQFAASEEIGFHPSRRAAG